ncbi:chromosome segregation ATPase [Peptoniphilus olsenii]|uniref:Chromosome segregation ATPase n=1 Tax=Peptoniphilus olsenii TaxID=411570 RepID=A0ABV2J8K5_9FIRM
MKREFLEELGLEKEVIDKIMNENGKDINVEKAKVSAKDKEIKTLEEQIKTANKEIKSYKDMNIEDIQKSVETWKSKAKEHEEALKNLKNDTALKDAVRTYNSVDEDVLLKLIDRENIKFNDDGIDGLKEQVESLKESKPYLFKEVENSNDDRFNAHTPPDSSGRDISEMESEIANVFNE